VRALDSRGSLALVGVRALDSRGSLRSRPGNSMSAARLSGAAASR